MLPYVDPEMDSVPKGMRHRRTPKKASQSGNEPRDCQEAATSAGTSSNLRGWGEHRAGQRKAAALESTRFDLSHGVGDSHACQRSAACKCIHPDLGQRVRDGRFCK